MFFLGCLSLILLIIVRAFVIIIRIFKGHKTKKKLSNDTVKILIIIGSGGHTSEMMHLVEALDGVRYSPRLYIMASSDTWSEQKIHDYEKNLTNKGSKNNYEVHKIPRSRIVNQSYVTSVYTTLYATLASVPVMLRFNPEFILCNGPGTCIPICIIAFVMKCFFVSNNTILFVESICRVKSMSLSGKILQWFADEILVQWPELTLKCRRAKYIGRVV